MATTMADIRLQPSLLIVPDLSTLLNSCCYRLLAKFWHKYAQLKPELNLATFYLVWNLKKWPIDNKYNLGLCVLMPKFATLSQQ